VGTRSCSFSERVHHRATAYSQRGRDLWGEKKGALFRMIALATGRTLTNQPMNQSDAWRMIRRRSHATGINTRITSKFSFGLIYLSVESRGSKFGADSQK
jgi:hypothetical protein